MLCLLQVEREAIANLFDEETTKTTRMRIEVLEATSRLAVMTKTVERLKADISARDTQINNLEQQILELNKEVGCPFAPLPGTDPSEFF